METIKIDYKVPSEAIKNIPDYFFIAMAGELVSIFGIKVLLPVDYENDGSEIYDLQNGTAGWHAAFIVTCKKLNMQWLEDYYKSLSTWIAIDLFGSEIDNEIIEKVCKSKPSEANDYCNYIFERWISKNDR